MLPEANCAEYHPLRAAEMPSDGFVTCRPPAELCADWETDLLEESARHTASWPEEAFGRQPATRSRASADHQTLLTALGHFACAKPEPRVADVRAFCWANAVPVESVLEVPTYATRAYAADQFCVSGCTTVPSAPRGDVSALGPIQSEREARAATARGMGSSVGMVRTIPTVAIAWAHARVPQLASTATSTTVARGLSLSVVQSSNGAMSLERSSNASTTVPNRNSFTRTSELSRCVPQVRQ